MHRLPPGLMLLAFVLSACFDARSSNDPTPGETTANGSAEPRPTASPATPHTDPTASPVTPETDPTASPATPHTDPTASPKTLDTDPTASPVTSGSGRTFSAKPIPSQETDVLTGMLGFGAVEGGCGFLETADGKRYEVIYPDGWRLDRATGRLLGPNGQIVMSGETVSVSGSVATDMASICQVGPIFRASAVTAPRGFRVSPARARSPRTAP